MHPAAEPLIVYASLLAPEPIPLLLFTEVHHAFAEPLASALTEPDGLDEIIAALRTFALAEPAIKAPPKGRYSLNALVTVEAAEGRFLKVAGSGWIAARHLEPLGRFETDPVAVAERFLGTPYLWGGRDSLGIDCSGLVQQALYACGRGCPRDSDQQAATGAAGGLHR